MPDVQTALSKESGVLKTQMMPLLQEKPYCEINIFIQLQQHDHLLWPISLLNLQDEFWRIELQVHTIIGYLPMATWVESFTVHSQKCWLQPYFNFQASSFSRCWFHILTAWRIKSNNVCRLKGIWFYLGNCVHCPVCQYSSSLTDLSFQSNNKLSHKTCTRTSSRTLQFITVQSQVSRRPHAALIYLNTVEVHGDSAWSASTWSSHNEDDADFHSDRWSWTAYTKHYFSRFLMASSLLFPPLRT